jgi:nucleoside-triphosphatase THEP1
MTKRNFLITGPPRCGKSTVIEKVVGRIERPAIGFFTREIREKGKRVGFSITTLDGRGGILAHQNIVSRFRVGKYGVSIEDIENIAVPAMIPKGKGEVAIIDEIGKMECFSLMFRETLIQVLDLPNWVIASIAQKGGPFIQSIKEREDVFVISVTTENRDMLVEQIMDCIKYCAGTA